MKSNSSINSEEVQEKENTCIFHSPGNKTGHDTQGCGVGVADAKLSSFIGITLFNTKT